MDDAGLGAGRCPDTQLVVMMTEATAERLGRDARLGRAVRLVALPVLAGVGAVFGLQALAGFPVAMVFVLVTVVLFLAWETVGPGGRRRRALMVELEAAIEQLQSAGTAAPSPDVDDGPGMVEKYG